MRHDLNGMPNFVFHSVKLLCVGQEMTLDSTDKVFTLILNTFQLQQNQHLESYSNVVQMA